MSMKNAGVYVLASGKARPAEHKPVRQLEGMTAVSLEFELIDGVPGDVCIVRVQTSFDTGPWRDIARVDVVNYEPSLSTAIVRHCNIEGLLSKGITPYADLQREGVYDGILGDSLRCVVKVRQDITIGAGVAAKFASELTVRAAVR
jgi:hypothetical protein